MTLRHRQYLTEGKVSAAFIDKVVQKWVAPGYREGHDPAGPIHKDVVFRVMSKSEWEKIKEGYISGSFWSSNPAEHAGLLDSASVVVVAKTDGYKSYAGWPDEEKIKKGKQHFHNLDRKKLKDVYAVYSKSGSTLKKIYSQEK